MYFHEDKITTTNRYSLKDLLKQYDATRFENFLNTVAYMLIPVADQAHALQDIFRKHSSDLDKTCSRQNASTDFEDLLKLFHGDATRSENFLNRVAYILVPAANQEHAVQAGWLNFRMNFLKVTVHCFPTHLTCSCHFYLCFNFPFFVWCDSNHIVLLSSTTPALYFLLYTIDGWLS